VDSQSTTLDYDNKGRLIQAYANPGGITTHFNYRSDGKLSTITSSSVPYIDTVVYAGDNISAVVVLAADHTPMDTTIFSVNPDGWITDVRVNLRITRLSPSIYGHITYNYENNQLKTVSQSVENLQPIHPTSVFLPNNLPVDDPKNPFASISRETLFLFYEIFNRDALGSFWTVGNIEDLNYTDPTKVIDEEQYVYRLDSNKNVVHRDVLLASDVPGFSTFLISSDNNYTYDCK
jgi:YD repeat-containing protein